MTMKAEIDIELRATIVVFGDGKYAIKRVNTYSFPPSLSRPMTKAELRETPEADGDPLWGGGVAILQARTTAQRTLERAAKQVSEKLRSALDRHLRTFVGTHGR